MSARRAVSQEEYSRVFDSVGQWAFDHATDVHVRDLTYALIERHPGKSADELPADAMKALAEEYPASEWWD